MRRLCKDCTYCNYAYLFFSANICLFVCLQNDENFYITRCLNKDFFFAEVWLSLTAYQRRGSSILTAERREFINQYLQDCCDLSNY
ncbi:uncharacterized protein BX663DRAFT_447620, partial [Cokeromyces recurvatus]|uniref:uncharacterized protein n=1 Tax=Cokeromyces recurvatus TaxID=90255 RepID=UPI00221FACD8